MPDDIQFQNDYTPEYSSSETPKMVQWVMKLSDGKIQDEKQANLVLIGLVVVIVIISLFLVFGENNKNQTQIPIRIPTSPEESPF